MSYILLPIDFVPTSANALRYGMHFADAIGTEIVLLHIIYPEFEMLDLPVISLQTTREKIDIARVKMQELVDEALTQIQIEHDLESIPILRADIEIGTPAPVITTIAEQHDISMIIMGMRDKHSSIEEWLGTVTRQVTSRSMKPVLVLPHEYSFKPPKRILYASDFCQEDRSGIAWIHEKWKAFSPEIDILHIHPEDKKTGIENYKVQLGIMDKLKHEFPKIRILHEGANEPVKGLLDFADIHDYDLVALFSPKRNWWERLTHQSVSQQLIKLAQTPVLILK